MITERNDLMYNFDECKTASSVKNKAREISFNDLIEMFSEKYGVDNVSVTNNNTIAVCLGYRTLADKTSGEVCVEIKPVAKDFDTRIAESGKEFKCYERIKEADAYEVAKTEKEKEAEHKAKEREENRRKKEEEKKKKKEDKGS